MVHCQTGNDASSVICSLAQIMSDPYYRTFEGLRSLILKDWVLFMHDFVTKSGLMLLGNDGIVPRGEYISTVVKDSQAQMMTWENVVNNRECMPIFVFFLDCLSQLIKMNPMQFEFQQSYLVHLAVNSLSNKYFETTTPIYSVDFSGKKEL